MINGQWRPRITILKKGQTIISETVKTDPSADQLIHAKRSTEHGINDHLWLLGSGVSPSAFVASQDLVEWVGLAMPGKPNPVVGAATQKARDGRTWLTLVIQNEQAGKPRRQLEWRARMAAMRWRSMRPLPVDSRIRFSKRPTGPPSGQVFLWVFLEE